MHGLDVDFLGVWNENPSNPDYVVALRAALDGFSPGTKIIAPDRSTKDANNYIAEMRKTPALAAATHAVGYHYPNSNPGVTPLPGIPLWASEDDSSVDPPADAPPTPRPRQVPGVRSQAIRLLLVFHGPF